MRRLRPPLLIADLLIMLAFGLTVLFAARFINWFILQLASLP